tara:strand:- start:634 stop:1041 length:408 start_codon:yes stop_codon:yes gene_type:complete
MKDPVFHKFVVFSLIDESGDVIPKIAKCNNCGVLHKVTDFCKSEIVYGIDESFATLNIVDISWNIPENIKEVLETHRCDIATWEQVSDIISSKEWGNFSVIAKKEISGSTQIKLLFIEENNKYRIESHLRKDDLG